MPKVKSEHMEQVSFFQKLRTLYKKRPEYKHLIFAIPNGGQRHPSVALKMQAEGQKSGTPDVFCAIPKGKWHGLFIELKKIDGSGPSESQKKALAELSRAGYATAVAWGANSMFEALEAYLDENIDAYKSNNPWFIFKKKEREKIEK